MTPTSSISTSTAYAHNDVINYYIDHGWSLVPIAPGSKGPSASGWNKESAALEGAEKLPPNYGVGLMHAYSGTMALDIDDMDLADAELRKYGIDLTQLLMDDLAVSISSGRPGRAKLLYQLDTPIPTKKVTINGKTAYELRCAAANGLSVQDVLPPSIHPDTGKPYEWKGAGHWKSLQHIPIELLKHWMDLNNPKTMEHKPTEIIDVDQKVSWELVKDALKTINPDCPREQWITIAMALKDAGVKDGCEALAQNIWDEWSSRGEKYKGPKEIDYQWSTLNKHNGVQVKLGTLFQLATNSGWLRPDVKEVVDLSMFKDITDPYPEIKSTTGAVLPPLNVDLFPEPLKNRAMAVSVQIAADPAVSMFAGLVAASGALDSRTRLELLPGFRVPGNIWAITSASPALKKTPASAPMFAPLFLLEKEDRQRYAKAVQEWTGHEAQHAITQKAFTKYCESPEFITNPGGAPDVYPLPPKPTKLKLVVNDITSQQLVYRAYENQHGMLYLKDECHSWMVKLNDPRSGDDRSTWVAAYESNPYSLDRVGAGEYDIDNFSLSFYGNIQPHILREQLQGLGTDGLFQRLITVPLDESNIKGKGIGTRLKPGQDFVEEWEQAIRRIRLLPINTYTLSLEAEKLFEAYTQRLLELRHAFCIMNTESIFMGCFGKLEGLAGRIMLLFHVLTDPFNDEVSVEIAEHAIELVFTFIVPNMQYLLIEAGQSPFDLWLRDYVLQRAVDGREITAARIRSDAHKQYFTKVSKENANMSISIATDTLIEAGWLISNTKPGTHAQFGKWSINPKLNDAFKEKQRAIIEAKQAIIDLVEPMRGKKLAVGYRATIR